MLRRSFIILALACLGTGLAHAGSGGLSRSASGDGVTIDLSSPFSDLPPGGCVPYRVKVDNDRDSEGTWRIRFNGANNYGTWTSTYEEKVTVPAHTSSVFNLLVPLPMGDEHANIYVTLGVVGPGFDNSSSNFGYVYSGTGSTMPFAAHGEKLLGKAGTGPLETYYKDKGETFYGTSVETARLPTDWRGYSGLARLFLTDTDWLDLSAPQRQALLDWIAQGGRLSIVAIDVSDERVAALQLPTSDNKAGPYGFGNILVEAVTNLPPDAEFLATASHRDPAPPAQSVDANFSTWGLRDGVGTIILHGGFILCFVLAFGALVGPINLFVFARGGKRFRLFWTTPLISIAASLALVAGILFTDGLGGHGKRLTAILSMPESNREAVVQEQIARTAVLFSNRWHGDEGYLVSPISDNVLDGTIRTNNAYYRSRRSEATADSYNKIGNDYTGHWFHSRSMTGQYLQMVRPSRSSITVVNSSDAAFGPGNAPVILSSYPQTLSQVYLVDHDGKYWWGENVGPGRKTTLTASTPENGTTFLNDACKDAGGKLRPLLLGTRNRSGYFYATGEATPGQVLPTLGEVHWQDNPTIYLGPWVAGTSTEKGP